MNLHPLFVHFPIACLILYTMIEVVSLFCRNVREKLLNTKYFLLFVGVIGTAVALQSGEIAEHLMGGESTLIETHSTFANLTHFFYMIIAVIYALMLIIQNKIGERYWTPLIAKHQQQRLTAVLTNSYTHYGIVVLSIIGCILLSITGALWGAISYGPDTDPIVQFVYNIFVGQ